jgi:hypothetical protein
MSVIRRGVPSSFFLSFFYFCIGEMRFLFSFGQVYLSVLCHKPNLNFLKKLLKARRFFCNAINPSKKINLLSWIFPWCEFPIKYIRET